MHISYNKLWKLLIDKKQDNIYGFQYSPDQLAPYYKTIAADRSNIKYGK